MAIERAEKTARALGANALNTGFNSQDLIEMRKPPEEWSEQLIEKLYDKQGVSRPPELMR